MKISPTLLRYLRITTIALVVIFAFYSTVIEPSTIVTEHLHIPTGIDRKIILISDIHLGIYKSSDFLRKTVEIINRNHPDYVLIAGDLTLFFEKPTRRELEETFAPLRDIESPTYAILGNHDLRHPGPDLARDLVDVLEKDDIHILNNDIVELPDFTLVGLGEYWSLDSDTSLFQRVKNPAKTIALIHNPDILSQYSEDAIPTLSLAGHVHGGQIRIPWLYKRFIPSKKDFDRGYYEEAVGTKKARLFVSQWLGETGLPARFLCPPALHVIDLK